MVESWSGIQMSFPLGTLRHNNCNTAENWGLEREKETEELVGANIGEKNVLV